MLECCDDRLNSPNIPRSTSAPAVARPASARRWDRSAIATTIKTGKSSIAMAESFFATLECELIDRRRFDDPDHARREIFRFIEGWYNPRRRHSAIGYKSPINYERSIPPVALTFNSPRKRGNSSSTMRLRTSREPGPRRPRHIASRRSSTRFRAGRRYLLHADPVRSSHPPPPPPGQGGQHGFDRGSRRCSDAQYRIP